MMLHRLLGIWALWLPLGDLLPVLEPEEYVQPLCGTFTDGQKFSTGNTLPLVARPWGMNHWSVQTNAGTSSWWFGGNDHTFHWLRLTHQPSPWIGDWAWLLFGPQMGGMTESPTMFWEPRAAHWKAHIFETMLAPDNLQVQLTATDHGAVLKVGFPAHNPGNHQKRVCFKLPPPDKGKNPGQFTGSSTEKMTIEAVVKRAPPGTPSNFGLHVRAEVDVSSLQGEGGKTGASVSTHSPTMHCFEFSPRETHVTVWIGTSLLGADHAEANLAAQARGRSFDDVAQESKRVWNEHLRRIEVVDAGEMTEENFRRLTVFYTGLYRALLFPRRLDEPDLTDKAKRIHWSPYAGGGGTFPGPLVTDNGFWDTFRTVYTLLNLAYPDEAGWIVQGWVNSFKEGGWLPQWASPGYRDSMVGTFADVTLADAIIKDIPHVDKEMAWKAIEKDAFTEGTGVRGKKGYKHYSKLGYIPHDVGVSDTVSLTLDFGFADFAAAKAAKKLHKSAQSQTLHDRARKARDSLFDAQTGLMRPKSKVGSFQPSFDPSVWGNGYVEGSAWHHSFPPYDLSGLAALHGGRVQLAQKIKEMLETPGTFKPGGYRHEIHEMTEMRALAMGQYGHNNQPSHHILWLLPQLDDASAECIQATLKETHTSAFCPRRLGESAIHEVLERAYGTEHYAGDEDNGEMGAWAVLAMIGLFEPVPGGDEGYVLGSPVFRHVRIWRDGFQKGKSIDVISSRAGHLRHVSKVLVDKREMDTFSPFLSWTIGHDSLVRAEQIRFLTGSESPQDPVVAAAEPVGAKVGVGSAGVVKLTPKPTDSSRPAQGLASGPPGDELGGLEASEEAARVDTNRESKPGNLRGEHREPQAPPSEFGTGRPRSLVGWVLILALLGIVCRSPCSPDGLPLYKYLSARFGNSAMSGRGKDRSRTV